jgi:CDP-paratose 2-epimerase
VIVDRDESELEGPAMEPHRDGTHVLITGGAGFVGCNLADRLLAQGERVTVLDSLARAGVEANARWLRQRWGDRVRIVVGDTRDRDAVAAAMRGAAHVFHFAAQVAVTTSLVDPVQDFEVNARGTLNVLEEARARALPPAVYFTSTNKVYGSLPDVAMRSDGRRWLPEDPRLAVRGIDESRPLDLHSPYGCSKGAADQYLLDYARTFGLRTVVFRMSCIYGPRQFGTEDQGWVAHFLIRALAGEPITIYGDGQQVRDVLYVEDLVDAFLCARRDLERTAGHAYNIGGGPGNAIGLIDAIDAAGDLVGERLRLTRDAWRPGDQRWYVSDTTRFHAATGWRPRIGWREGMDRLHRWLVGNRIGAEALAVARDEA